MGQCQLYLEMRCDFQVLLFTSTAKYFVTRDLNLSLKSEEFPAHFFYEEHASERFKKIVAFYGALKPYFKEEISKFLEDGDPKEVLTKNSGFQLSKDGKTGLSINDSFDHVNLLKMWVSNFYR